ncbi:Glutathione S transferase E12 [Carabus blaptoides fortunei]
MARVLYCVGLSPPVRAVLLTARALGIELEKKEINLQNGDHLTPEYLKVPILFLGQKEIPKRRVDNLLDGFAFLETFLENRKWLAGDDMTIADLCNGSSVISVEVIASRVPVTLDNFPRIQEWVNRLKEIPYFEEINKPGLQQLGMTMNENMDQ